MTDTADQPRGLQRFPTGIAGLDTILGGGLFVGGNYLIVGPPGAGKTILGNQLCFHHVASASGRRAIYMSLLAEMMRGGLPAGSMTLLLGAAGTGKTLLGSHFLMAGVAAGERGLYFGFYETPSRLERKLARFGLDATRARAKGLLEILWQSPVQHILDTLAEHLLEVVQRKDIRRLFIDGLGGYDSAIREFRITDQGIDVAPTFSSAQAISTGVALVSHHSRHPTPFEAEDALEEGGQP